MRERWVADATLRSRVGLAAIMRRTINLPFQQFIANTTQNTILCLPCRRCAHFQFLRDIDGGLTIENLSLKCLPGPRIHIRTNHIHRTMDEPMARFQIIGCVAFFEQRWNLHEFLLGVAAANADERLSLLAEMQPHLVTGNGPQPTAKIVPRCCLEFHDVGGHRQQHILQNVGSVMGLQPRAANPTVNQWRVDSNETLPSVGFINTKSSQQVDRCGKGILGRRGASHGIDVAGNCQKHTPPCRFEEALQQRLGCVFWITKPVPFFNNPANCIKLDPGQSEAPLWGMVLKATPCGPAAAGCRFRQFAAATRSGSS